MHHCCLETIPSLFIRALLLSGDDLVERERMTAIGTTRKKERARSMSGSAPKAAIVKLPGHFRDVPCVDGSRLARVFFTCRAGRCSHVFGLFARFT
jgi:hypothetical protein